MADPFVGEIKIFGGNYAPKGWAYCDGQVMQISAHDALFSLIGTTYGGNGQTTFALPDLRGRLPVHSGQGPGLSLRQMGQRIGTETETLITDQVPTHDHPFMASTQNAISDEITGHVFAHVPTDDSFYAEEAPNKQKKLIEGTVQPAGHDQAHGNIMPFQCINFIIALVGTYPSRN